MCSVKSLNRSHGGLDVQGLHVLPVLLQQGDEEVHGEMDVLDELLLGHPDIANSHGEAEDLLHLELDGGLQVSDLGLQVVAVGHQGGELSSLRLTNVSRDNSDGVVVSHLVKPRSQQSGDLLDQSVGSQEGVVLSRQLLHLLLVLVQLLEVVSGHGGDADRLGLVNVLLISQKADSELLTGDVLQPRMRSYN